MRILVTNDDGIDSVGLHVLARALGELGDVVVAAPDSEYSGASAAIGAIHLMHPEVRRTRLDGVAEAWTVAGAPALCVTFARQGLFGPPFDLVVAGINPGANVGRAVYHSGTVGAAMTARNAGVTGIAVSQDVSMGSVEGQAWDGMLANMRWQSAATIAVTVARGVLAHPPAEAQLINVNVPNLAVEELRGWRVTELASAPTRSFAPPTLEPKIGHEDAYKAVISWGEPVPQDPASDAGAVDAGYVSISWLSRIVATGPPDGSGAAHALRDLLGG